VTALDKYEKHGYRLCRHHDSLNSTDGQPDCGSYTFVAADQGVKSLSATLKTAGSQR